MKAVSRCRAKCGVSDLQGGRDARFGTPMLSGVFWTPLKRAEERELRRHWAQGLAGKVAMFRLI